MKPGSEQAIRVLVRDGQGPNANEWVILEQKKRGTRARVLCALRVHFFDFPSGGVVMPGSKCDIFFLLHQSIDLDELYPTVRVSQIVTRRKYFFPDVWL